MISEKTLETAGAAMAESLGESFDPYKAQMFDTREGTLMQAAKAALEVVDNDPERSAAMETVLKFAEDHIRDCLVLDGPDHVEAVAAIATLRGET